MSLKIRFESETCSRCGGTGRMPYAAYGGVCFKCNGHTKVYTRRGRAAYQRFAEAKQTCFDRVGVADLKPGDKVSFNSGQTWKTVTEAPDLTKVCGWAGTGEGGDDKVELIGVETQRAVHLVRRTDEVLRWSREGFRSAVAKVAHLKGAIVTDTEADAGADTEAEAGADTRDDTERREQA